VAGNVEKFSDPERCMDVNIRVALADGEAALMAST